MAIEDLTNIEQLLTPVDSEQPAGIDLREDTGSDAIYYTLKDARNSARSIERNSFPGDDNEEKHSERLHWKQILKLAPKALQQSKDLEIAAWYTEALIREYGFAGLKQGFTLINGLIQNFWQDLYPLPDEDGISTRVAVLVGLNGINNSVGTLIAPINTAPITADGTYSTWSYNQAQELDKTKDPAAKKKKIEAGAVSVDTIKSAVKPSQSEFYFELDADISAALTEFTASTDKLDELCGDDTPPSTNIRKALESAQKTVRVIAKDILMPEPEQIETGNDGALDNASGIETTADSEATNTEFKTMGSIKGRIEAFKTLQLVAEFFKRTEPHSPIGYAIERIVRWGDMSLPELLQELVPDPQAKDYYEKLVGLLPPQPQMDPNAMSQHGMNPTMQQPDQYGGYDNSGGYDNGMNNDSDYPQHPGGYDNPLFK